MQKDELCFRTQENTRTAKLHYATIKKSLDHKTKRKLPTIKDSAGRLLTDEKDVLKRWKSYCMQLYEHLGKEPNTTSPSEKEPEPTYEDEKYAIKNLKNDKCSGPDEIPAGLLERLVTLLSK